jgi:hypothetical protein
LILHDLKALGLIEFSEVHMQEMGALEFHITLSRGYSECHKDRMRLQKDALREQVLSGMRALAMEDEKFAAVLKLI